MQLTTAGHPYPVLVRDGTATAIGRPGSLVGITVRPTFDVSTVGLVSGDVVVLFTDGATEGRRADGEFFGEPRLEDLLTVGLQGEWDANDVVREVTAFQDGLPRDDVVVVSVRVR